MIGFSQLLVDEHASGLNETARLMLKRIQASSEFMDKLLFDLLAYARTASIPLKIGSVDAEKAWDAALLQCEAQVRTMGAYVHQDGPFPSVRADKTMLGHVLANLLSNALKFVPPGVQPRIHFRAANYGKNTRLWLEDNGTGIPAEYHERIFRVFERLNGAKHPGTGIGLSIVRKGVERMGGKVGVESAPGTGSRFWIELPKAIVENSERA
jgi:signal transduction histidine kinase